MITLTFLQTILYILRDLSKRNKCFDKKEICANIKKRKEKTKDVIAHDQRCILQSGFAGHFQVAY